MRKTQVQTANRITIGETTERCRRHSGSFVCALAVAVAAIAGCGGGGSDVKSAAPSAGKGLVFTKSVGAVPAGVTFKQGRATVTAGTKTYELAYRPVTSDRPVTVVRWARQFRNTTSELFIVFESDGTAKAYANGTPFNARGCSIQISRSDATALVGAFDCPKARPAVSGSFSATL